MSNNGQIYSVPFKCRDYPDYLRALEVAELLNRENGDFPITISLGSGPKDPKAPGVRYCDVQCASGAKIQHFMELGAELDADIKDLERVHKLVDPASADDFGGPGFSDPFADIFGAFGGDPAAAKRLSELQNRIRKLKDDKGPG